MSGVMIVVEFNNLAIADELTNTVEIALTRALNRTADRSRTKAAKTAREQVAFPASYVSPANKRLWVKTRARRGTFLTTIEGRSAPTSLARFTKQKPRAAGSRQAGKPINVTVNPGSTKLLKRAFLIRLKSNNIGLAMRTDGAAPNRAYKPRPIGKNLWLLYGPSVDQALSAASNDGGIFEEMTPDMLDFLESEFNRQLEVLEK